MPDPLEALLRSIGEIMAKLFGNVIEWLMAWIKNTWAVIMSLWTILFWVLDYIHQKMEFAFDNLAKLATDYGSSAFPAVIPGIQFANSVVPIAELLSFLAVYLVAAGIVTIYRFVKSWIPTLS